MFTVGIGNGFAFGHHDLLKHSPMNHRRTIARFVGFVCTLGLAVLPSTIFAQSNAPYPSKTIKLVVPYTPGSGPDITARLIAEKLPALLGGTAMVDNRAGASGVIGTAMVARAAPDGLTLLVSMSTHVITAAVRKLDYNPITDFIPIAEFSRGSFVVVVPASSPVKSIADLVHLLKTSKGDLAYSSAGVASTVHLFTETLLRATGTTARHIPGKGVTGAMMDVLQNHVDFTVAPVSIVLPQIKSGKIRLLAQTNSKRSPLIPDVPTVIEAGYVGFEATLWLGLYAHAGTPPAIVAQLNRATNTMLARPDVVRFLEQNGMEPSGGTPEQFLSLNKTDLAKFTAVVQSANITAD